MQTLRSEIRTAATNIVGSDEAELGADASAQVAAVAPDGGALEAEQGTDERADAGVAAATAAHLPKAPVKVFVHPQPIVKRPTPKPVQPRPAPPKRR
jgi:hypothetical protein